MSRARRFSRAEPGGKFSAKEDVAAAVGNDRGRHASDPTEFPAAGWRDILRRSFKKIGRDNLSIIAAGIAYYAFVASVPGLFVIMTIYARLADPAGLTHHLNLLSRVVPKEVFPLIQEQILRIARGEGPVRGGAVLGASISLYSSAKATKALMSGLNIAYNQRERRNFFHRNAIALALTASGIVGVLVALELLTGLPALLHEFFPQSHHHVLAWLRWPVLVVWFLIGAAAAYRFAPCRPAAHWKWISWGAAVSTVLWVAGSALFSFYVAEFDRYAKTYGSLGAVVIFLIWLYLSAYFVLLGAELNSEMEQQTDRDTSAHPEKLGNSPKKLQRKQTD